MAQINLAASVIKLDSQVGVSNYSRTRNAESDLYTPTATNADFDYILKIDKL